MKKKILALLMALTVSCTAFVPVAFASDNIEEPAAVIVEDDIQTADIVGEIVGGVVEGIISDIFDEQLFGLGGLIAQSVANMVDRYLVIDNYLPKPSDNTVFDEDFYNSEAGLAWRSAVDSFFSEAFIDVAENVTSFVFGDIIGKIVAGELEELNEIFGEEVASELMTYDEILRQFENEYINPYYRSIDDFTGGTFGILELPENSGTTSGTVLKKVSSGSVSFLSGFITPILKMCSTSPICLAFLTVTFVGLGALMIRRFIRAFGRGC